MSNKIFAKIEGVVMRRQNEKATTTNFKIYETVRRHDRSVQNTKRKV